MQQRTVEGLFKKAALCIGTLLTLTVLAGCSGGGSGAPPTLIYSGATTPVVIDADNAYDLLTGAYQGGATTSVFNIFGAAGAEPVLSANRPRMLTLAESLQTFLSAIDLQSHQPEQYAGAIITDSETISGSCGGSVYYEVGIDSIFGDFSGTADFREYCDAGNPNLVLDGLTDFSGDFDLLSQEIDDFEFIFRDLAGTSSEESFTLNGRLYGSVSETWADITTTSVIKDDTTGKTYWLKDFNVTALQGDGFVVITADGRYYDHDYGYVDVSTEQPFILNNNNDWPASGILLLTGAEGTAGGNTMARLVVLDADSFKVEADTDGDGAFDDYNSDPLPWADI